MLVLAAVCIGGRYALRYALRIVALTNTRELFTAMALLVVIAVSLVMQSLGLSMALGAFLAGVLLADSEYRHALEADIEPFKGLLLGLFFMSVGMSLNLGMIVAEPLKVAAMVAGLVGIKFAILYAVGRINGLEPGSSRALAIAALPGRRVRLRHLRGRRRNRGAGARRGRPVEGGGDAVDGDDPAAQRHRRHRRTPAAGPARGCRVR